MGEWSCAANVICVRKAIVAVPIAGGERGEVYRRIKSLPRKQKWHALYQHFESDAAGLRAANTATLRAEAGKTAMGWKSCQPASSVGFKPCGASPGYGAPLPMSRAAGGSIVTPCRTETQQTKKIKNVWLVVKQRLASNTGSSQSAGWRWYGDAKHGGTGVPLDTTRLHAHIRDGFIGCCCFEDRCTSSIVLDAIGQRPRTLLCPCAVCRRAGDAAYDDTQPYPVVRSPCAGWAGGFVVDRQARIVSRFTKWQTEAEGKPAIPAPAVWELEVDVPTAAEIAQGVAAKLKQQQEKAEKKNKKTATEKAKKKKKKEPAASNKKAKEKKHSRGGAAAATERASGGAAASGGDGAEAEKLNSEALRSADLGSLSLRGTSWEIDESTSSASGVCGGGGGGGLGGDIRPAFRGSSWEIELVANTPTHLLPVISADIEVADTEAVEEPLDPVDLNPALRGTSLDIDGCGGGSGGGGGGLRAFSAEIEPNVEDLLQTADLSMDVADLLQVDATPHLSSLSGGGGGGGGGGGEGGGGRRRESGGGSGGSGGSGGGLSLRAFSAQTASAIEDLENTGDVSGADELRRKGSTSKKKRK